jgi:hypothetical protein
MRFDLLDTDPHQRTDCLVQNCAGQPARWLLGQS